MTGPAPADFSRKWLVMAAVGMGILLATVDASIVNIALPTLEAEFDVPFAVVQWVVVAYLVTLATLTVTIGRWGDMVGKKRIYTAGLALFTVASTLAGLSPGIYWLIGFRALQGVGAAVLSALGLGIITEAFPRAERGKALGVGGSIVSVGIVLGPSLGGLLIDSLGWRWIFFVNLPLGIAAVVMASRLIPHGQPRPGQRFDPAGATLFLVAMLPVLLGLSFGQEVGFAAPWILGLFALSAVATVAFVVVERRVEQPMLDLRMFDNSDFTIGLITGFLSFAALLGYYIVAPFFLSETLGYGPREVGLIIAAAPVALGVVAPLSGRLSDRIGPRPVTVVGLVVIAVGYWLLSGVSGDTSALTYVLFGLPIGIGMGIFQSPNNSAVMGSVRAERLGVAGAMLGVNRIVGQLAGVAVISTFWASRLASREAVMSDLEAGAGAFTDVTRVSVGIILVALALAAWELGKEIRAKRVVAAVRSAPAQD